MLTCIFPRRWDHSSHILKEARDSKGRKNSALYFLLVIKFHYQHFNYHLYVDTCLLDLCLQPTLVLSELYIYSHMPNECCNGMPKSKIILLKLRSFKIYPYPQIFVNGTILNLGGQTKNQVLSLLYFFPVNNLTSWVYFFTISAFSTPIHFLTTLSVVTF